MSHNIKYVLTAHHQDDQIETIYMAESNNSSWVSKIGIRDISFIDDKESKVYLIRPMLSISKKNIIKYANQRKLKYYDDPTNLDLRFFRNKVRQDIQKKINDADFRANYLNISNQSKDKISVISKCIDNQFNNLIFFLKSKDLCILNKELLIQNNFDFIFLFLKKILSDHFNFKENLSSNFWKSINKYIISNKSGTIFTISNNICISKNLNYLYIYKSKISETLKGSTAIGNHFLRLGTLSVTKSNDYIYFDNKEGITIPLNFSKDLNFSKWCYGDFCFSSNGNKLKVSDIYINNKLSLFHKNHYPILKYLDKIIWIPNLYSSVSEAFESFDKFLIIRWNANL